MVSYCPHCWTELEQESRTCPGCGAEVGTDSRNFKQKMMGALRHLLPEARARACWLLGINGAEAAVPLLIRTAQEDDDLFVRLAAVEALGHLHSLSIPAFLETLQEGADRRMAMQAGRSLQTYGHGR